MFGAEYTYVVKTDALGVMEWDRLITDPAGLGDTGGIARSVTVAPGGYAITGVVHDQEAGVDSAFLLRLNGFGKVITREHYNIALLGTTKTYLDGQSIQYTKDGFIIAGSAYGYGDLGLLSKRAAFLLKLSTSGKVHWFKPYGLSTFSSASSVCQTHDGGYILTGATDFFTSRSSLHAYIARTDSSGNELWSKTISNPFFAVSSGTKIIETSDGGYIMVGMAVPGSSAETLMVRLAPDIVARH